MPCAKEPRSGKSQDLSIKPRLALLCLLGFVDFWTDMSYLQDKGIRYESAICFATISHDVF